MTTTANENSHLPASYHQQYVTNNANGYGYTPRHAEYQVQRSNLNPNNGYPADVYGQGQSHYEPRIFTNPNMWQTELCDCCTPSCKPCAESLFCSDYQLTSIYNKLLANNPHGSCGDCMVLGTVSILTLGLASVMASCVVRDMVTKRYGIIEGCCSKTFTSVFCAACSTAQLMREVNIRGDVCAGMCSSKGYPELSRCRLPAPRPEGAMNGGDENNNHHRNEPLDGVPVMLNRAGDDIEPVQPLRENASTDQHPGLRPQPHESSDEQVFAAAVKTV